MKRPALLLAIVLLLPLLFVGIFSTNAQTRSQIKAVAAPDEVVIKYKPSTSETEKQKTRDKVKTFVKLRLDKLNAEVLKVPPNTVDVVLKQLENDPRIEYAEPNFQVKAFAITNDTSLSQEWGLFKIQAANQTSPSAWDVTTGGSNVKIAILDTGIEESHSDLSGKVVLDQNFTTASDVYDHQGHGTHVAGIAAAATNNGNGIAGTGYNTALISGKVLDDTGSGYYSWVANGITWSADQGAQVISMSLGGPYYSKVLEDAVNYAWNKGSVIVAAAGNDGSTSPSYPGYYSNVIAVAATDSTDTRAAWSNYGSWVDVAAPGVSIYSTYRGNSYKILSGTSMATPFAAGTAALIWMKGDCSTNVCVRQQLEKTADHILGTGTDFRFGRINAGAAVTTPLASPTATITPTPTVTPTSTPTQAPTVTPTPAQSLTVSDIALSYTVQSFGYRRVYATITVRDEATNAPVSGASVKATITTPLGRVSSYSGSTNTQGTVTFSKRSKELGTYTLKVTSVTKSSYVYHPTLTTKSILVQ